MSEQQSSGNRWEPGEAGGWDAAGRTGVLTQEQVAPQGESPAESTTDTSTVWGGTGAPPRLRLVAAGAGLLLTGGILGGSSGTTT